VLNILNLSDHHLSVRPSGCCDNDDRNDEAGSDDRKYAVSPFLECFERVNRHLLSLPPEEPWSAAFHEAIGFVELDLGPTSYREAAD
jgi:hypothetical protein